MYVDFVCLAFSKIILVWFNFILLLVYFLVTIFYIKRNQKKK
jgi:hypothetical protein